MMRRWLKKIRHPIRPSFRHASFILTNTVPVVISSYENESGSQRKLCMEINGEIHCLELNPVRKKNCLNIGGYYFCEVNDDDNIKKRSFKDEAQKFMNIILYPKLRTDETKQLEENIIEFTVGFVLSSLVFTLSLYIKDILDFFLFSLFPAGYNIFILFIIIAILIGVSLVLSIIRYRLKKAAKETRVLEQFAEKRPREIVNQLFDE